jgi:predicted acylesterase/phospholipase RssA
MSIQARFGIVAVCLAAALNAQPAAAQDPCAGTHARALVLGTGGGKGAFEAGAAYHLIVQRGCDFSEISGISVGAINGALLAQAAVASDPETSLANLRAAAESLIDQWTQIDSARDMMRSRPVARIRLGLFGLESLKDFKPLSKFVRTRVSLERLVAGRLLRIGTMTFDDGRYHEIVLNANGEVDPRTAHAYIFGSAIVPVFGDMPVIAASPAQPLAEREQFADGGVRHAAPVTSYFRSCRAATQGAPACGPLTGRNTPPHPYTEQMFVVVTSPYARRVDLRPPVDPYAFEPGTRQITDGRQILVRMFDLLIDTASRDDLDDMLMLNDLLDWRTRTAERLGSPLDDFPLESYNVGPGGASRPYTIALVAPDREDSDPATIFDVGPETISRQLFCGCVAAAGAMERGFGLPAMTGQCVSRFPRPPTRRERSSSLWDPKVCHDDRTSVSPANGR